MQACNDSFTRRRFGLTLSNGLAASLGVAYVGKALAMQEFVSVRNSQLKLLKELRTQDEIKQFYRHWDARIATPHTTATHRDWSYILDVVSSGKVHRWFYQTNGLVAQVGDKVQAVFQIARAPEFNVLIGAPKY